MVVRTTTMLHVFLLLLALNSLVSCSPLPVKTKADKSACNASECNGNNSNNPRIIKFINCPGAPCQKNSGNKMTDGFDAFPKQVTCLKEPCDLYPKNGHFYANQFINMIFVLNHGDKPINPRDIFNSDNFNLVVKNDDDDVSHQSTDAHKRPPIRDEFEDEISNMREDKIDSDDFSLEAFKPFADWDAVDFDTGRLTHHLGSNIDKEIVKQDGMSHTKVTKQSNDKLIKDDEEKHRHALMSTNKEESYFDEDKHGDHVIKTDAETHTSRILHEHKPEAVPHVPQVDQHTNDAGQPNGDKNPTNHENHTEVPVDNEHHRAEQEEHKVDHPEAEHKPDQTEPKQDDKHDASKNNDEAHPEAKHETEENKHPAEQQKGIIPHTQEPTQTKHEDHEGLAKVATKDDNEHKKIHFPSPAIHQKIPVLNPLAKKIKPKN